MGCDSNNNKLNIYLVHSPRQAYFIRKYIDRYRIDNNLIITDSDYNWGNINAKIIREPKFKFGFSYYKEWKVFLNKIKELKGRYKSTNLFISDIYWKINNALVFEVSWNEIYLIDDGTLNVQNHDFKILTSLKYYFLEMCNKLMLYPRIKGLSGKINGVDKLSYDGILTDNKKVLKKYSINRLLFTDDKIKVKENSIALVIGQNLDQVYGYSYYKKILEDIFRVLINKDITINYKPHPREGKQIRHELNSINSINYVETKLSVEEYFKVIRPSIVISMYSTGLINIARSSNAKCYYYKTMDYSNRKPIYDYMAINGILDFDNFRK